MTIFTEGVTTVSAQVAGWDKTANEGVGYSLLGTFKRDGSGVPEQIGGTADTVLHTVEDAGASAWSCTLEEGVASTVNLTCTGDAANETVFISHLCFESGVD